MDVISFIVQVDLLSKFRYKKPKRWNSATHWRSLVHILDVWWCRIQGKNQIISHRLGNHSGKFIVCIHFRLSQWTESKSVKFRNNGLDWCERCSQMPTFSVLIFQWISMYAWRQSCWEHAFWLYVFIAYYTIIIGNWWKVFLIFFLPLMSTGRNVLREG